MSSRSPHRAPDWTAERRRVLRTALGIGVATGAYGVSFGALSTTSGLTISQTCALSVLVFTGASQFAFVGVLLVTPDAGGAGHGSRLLMACVEHLRAEAFERAYTWVGAEVAQRAFLVGAGWAADGAHRELDLRDDRAVVVAQVRLHTDIRAVPPQAN